MSIPTMLPAPAEAPALPAAADRPGRFAGWRVLARTTPGLMIGFAVAAVCASLVVGGFTAAALQSRADALTDLAERTGPLTAAAHEVYRGLSDADATANSAFLAGGAETAAVRTRYETAIAQAQSALALAIAAREPADVGAGSRLAVLAAKLPVYTGLVETARANNQQGHPVGAAYQREASHLMRGELLPAAESLYADEVTARTRDQDSAGTWPWLEVLLGVALLAVLVAAQRFLWLRTGRRINVGFAVASVAALVSLVWVAVAATVVVTNVEAGDERGTRPADLLAQASVAALKARGAETLTLVARGNGAEYERDYQRVRADLTDVIDRAGRLAGAAPVADEIETARAAERDWYAVHSRIRQDDDQGDYTRAVAFAIETGSGAGRGAAADFDEVDRSLRAAIASTHAAFVDETATARTALTGVALGVAGLCLISAGGAVVGVRRRLQEYR